MAKDKGLFRQFAEVVEAIEAEYYSLDVRAKKLLHDNGFTKANLNSMLKIAYRLKHGLKKPEQTEQPAKKKTAQTATQMTIDDFISA